MNEFVRNSSNITKNNTTNDILYAINNNFVNIANNTINKEFLDEIKSPCQFNEHEVNTNITDIDFIVTTVQRTPIVLFQIQKAIWKRSYKILKHL